MTEIAKICGHDIAGGVSPGDRGVWGGGRIHGDEYHNTLDYITISTTGNATHFGDLDVERRELTSTDNSTKNRGVWMGGHSGSASDVIDYIFILLPGDAIDFGNLISGRRSYPGGCSNGSNDRGVCGGGYVSAAVDSIEYITISTPGNAQDFGDLTDARYHAGAAYSNRTNNRGCFAGGHDGTNVLNVIDYITISSTGNATDFGDLTTEVYRGVGTSNGTQDRGIHAGGTISGGAEINVIDYVTISSTSNATDFGDLLAEKATHSACSNMNNDRGCFGGGYELSYNNVIEYITISTTGNATDFGDLTEDRSFGAGCQNA